ncbi:uncharacterized protein LOC135337656 [Halichondria panicea]|uniref:uncharacterized protein LOC135337656 n=1 Tax=Halichondria panicea TaxID=6063 RepID=UPI00312B9A94
MEAFMKILLFSAILTTTVLGQQNAGCLGTRLNTIPECVAMQQAATTDPATRNDSLALFCYTQCFNLIFNAYEECGYTGDANPVTDCVSIITTVIPPATTYSTVDNNAGKDAASTLSALSVMTLLVVALTAFVTF